MGPVTRIAALLMLQSALTTTVAVAQTASTEATRIVAYAEAGLANFGADDSEQGNAVFYGGELQLRLWRALHAGIDASTGSIEPTRFGSDFRQTSLLISALGEWPSRAHIRALAGGGIGWLFQHKEGLFIRGPRPDDVVPFSSSQTAGVLHGRGGVVGDVGEHLRVRIEAVLAVGEGLSWVMGGRAAIGYSF